jgi:hypothetical protein
MRTITTTVYKLNELSKSSQEVAYQQWCQIDQFEDGFMKDGFMKDDIIELGNCIGININKVLYSGFHSQGDGACFTGDYEYKPNWKAKLEGYAPLDETMNDLGEALEVINKWSKSFSVNVTHSGRYYHENSVDIDCSYDDCETEAEEADRTVACNSVGDLLRKFMKHSYTLLEKEYEYSTSKEAFIDASMANEYEYYSDGKLYY